MRSPDDQPASQPAAWPADGLETLGRCPACGAAARHPLHEGLADGTFGVAPGRWTLWRCEGCRSGYLDPRPSPATIGLAYGRYYTHARFEARVPAGGLRGWRRWRRGLVNGHLARRHGLREAPALALGAWLVPLAPGWARRFSQLYRHAPPPRPGARLLDVGCGSGDFLVRARDCGWDVMGIDPDPQAAPAARSLGIAIETGGIEVLDGQAALFDRITLSHVAEHLHDPRATLAACLRLLRPGGTLWVETPNLDAAGHAVFGRHWHSLDAPRHLVLFNPASLARLLREVGFASLRRLDGPDPLPWIARASQAMALGLPPGARARPPARLRLRLAAEALRARAAPSRAEVLRLAAEAPP